MAIAEDPEVTIRPARRDERQALEDLMRRASLVSETYREALAANPDAIELPDGQIAAGEIWVAEIGGTIAGFCVVLMRNGRQAELDGLFVEPTSWRRGLGTRLVAHAVEVARAQGAAMLTVTAGREARGFYEAQGFVVTGEVETRFDTALAMRRPLGGKGG